MRVRVHNGDGSKYLGEGDYIADVTVYYVVDDRGALLSNHIAELYPPKEAIPYGGQVLESHRNPKIVLDSGDTVYGCQVWWEPIKEASVT